MTVAVRRTRFPAPATGLEGAGRKSASLLLFLFCVASATAAQPAPAPVPTLRWDTTEKTLAVEAENLSPEALRSLTNGARSDEDWARVIAVFTEPLSANTSAAAASALPAAVGAWRVVNGRLRFELRFPPAQGVRYRAVLNLPGHTPVEARFQPAVRSMIPTTSVVQVFPTSNVLPENQLKFYVEFSAPMSRGDVYQHIQIHDSAGRAIELPFLELDEELWDPAMTRLTLLIDPGRIKRGVKPLEDMGAVFEAGKNYRLVLDAGCRDAEGRPLRDGFTKIFRVGPADRTPPNPARWTVTTPRAGTLEPLVLDFGEAMDQALALRLITIVPELPTPATAPSRGTVPGVPALRKEEQEWTFTPDAPWARGNYRVSIAPAIEDLAGNNVGKTFDVDLTAGGSSRMPEENVTVRFEIR